MQQINCCNWLIRVIVHHTRRRAVLLETLLVVRRDVLRPVRRELFRRVVRRAARRLGGMIYSILYVPDRISASIFLDLGMRDIADVANLGQKQLADQRCATESIDKNSTDKIGR